MPESLEAARRGFGHSAVAGHTAMIAAEARALAADWPQHAPCEVLPRLKRAFSRMGARFCFGADAPGLTHAEVPLSRARDGAPPRTVYLPRWVPTTARVRLRHRLGALAGRIGAVMDRRLAEGRTAEPDLLNAMIVASQAHDVPPGPVITHLLATILVATQEMSTRAGGWLLFNLARHPEWTERIAAEAAALPADPDRVGAGHVARLALADAFVRETLRLYPPNWLTSRVVVEPTELDGHRLRPGDRVMVSPYLLHRDARHYEEPAAFRPERWLAARGPGTAGAYLPFGAGPRLCPGAALASMELSLVLAWTARHHRLSCPAPWPFRLETEGALRPEDLRLVFHRRG
ncbi:cytochrome P450 [Allonocardiopsis opalescens]|uniref:cytochrome P450 n=1 Tax=Allonocardiopsis opalescens TaxID=1144618 RepID=UPI0011B228F8|nr:cytochrome P450 [Allonocardiopsis opalescens]